MRHTGQGSMFAGPVGTEQAAKGVTPPNSGAAATSGGQGPAMTVAPSRRSVTPVDHF